MTQNYKSQVCIVGAGPVGLTLAMDLARRGVDVLVVEMRYRGEPPNVKCNHVSARSMEIFRQLGIVIAVRAAGLPDEYPNDVAYKTRFLGQELSRIKIPNRLTRYTASEGPDSNWPTAEPPHRINQIYLEPILFAEAEKCSGIRILNRTEVLDLQDQADGCVIYAENLENQTKFEIHADFIIGCDGGRSMVRKKMGVQLSGIGEIGKVQSTCIRAPGLIHLLKEKPAWATFSVNPERGGNVYAIDGKEVWLIHNYLLEGEDDFESIDRDRSIRQILGVDDQFKYDLISKEDWVARRLVADQFRSHRTFICGDAAHLWVPMAGYGMNAGIADAMNLSWTLAAYINGWAGESILELYQIERQPITAQVSKFAMNHAIKLHKERVKVPANIEENSVEGQESRNSFGQMLYDLNVRQYCCSGLNFGYYYDQSPAIVYDEELAPSYDMNEFTSSTVPGCRLPHFWLEDGSSLYDCLGQEYTLIQFDLSQNLQQLKKIADDKGIPLTVLNISQAKPEHLGYKHNFILVRPDQHVAWRGNELPHDLLRLMNVVTGQDLN